MDNARPGFKKTAHQFGHRKEGAVRRFRNEYEEMKQKVVVAWTKDALTHQLECERLMKSNQALAIIKLERYSTLAEQEARGLMRTVFDRFRAEIERIVVDLGGHPQDDGMVLFPDGSTAKMPRVLYIEKEKLLNLA